MSYINDALQKARARKDKGEPQDKVSRKSIWSSLTGAASAENKKTDTWQKWYTVIGLSIAFLYAVGIITVMYWSEIKPRLSTAPEVKGPVRITVEPIASPPAPPQVSRAVNPPVTPLAPSVADVKLPAANDMALPAPSAAAASPEVKKPAPGEPAALAEPEEKAPAPAADPKTLYAQALKMQRQGKLEEAKELYKQVIKAQPGNIKALNNLGVVYMKMKRYKWAIIRLNEAIRIKRDYVDAHYNLACLYAQINDRKKSMVYLKKAIALNPEARLWAARDADFKSLADVDDFKNLMQAQDN